MNNAKFQVVIDNGLLQLTLSNPGGLIRGIQYNGIDNLLELHNQDLNGGYSSCLSDNTLLFCLAMWGPMLLLLASTFQDTLDYLKLLKVDRLGLFQMHVHRPHMSSHSHTLDH